MLAAARALQLACLALNVVLAGWLVLHYTGSPPGAIGAGVVAAASPTLLEVHTAAWSEPLFLVLTGAGLAATSLYVETGKRPLLLSAAALFGLAGLTRYAWPPFLAAGLIAVILAPRVSHRRRLVDLSTYVALSIGLAIAWGFRNLSLTGNAFGDRPLSCSLPSTGHLNATASTLAAWLMPGADRIQIVPGQQQLLIATLGVVVLALAFASVKNDAELETPRKRWRTFPPHSLPRLLSTSGFWQ